MSRFSQNMRTSAPHSLKIFFPALPDVKHHLRASSLVLRLFLRARRKQKCRHFLVAIFSSTCAARQLLLPSGERTVTNHALIWFLYPDSVLVFTNLTICSSSLAIFLQPASDSAKNKSEIMKMRKYL
eukprot:comp22497_c0_seq19/m.56042 comp22497_c0_seq19/g.56042  ORF comp22497_c0_seq19/g.56042 comp22497_c0_seq19/m.56042 type:complete len:127 (-) comp22497_c0_seq19:131-511(-)